MSFTGRPSVFKSAFYVTCACGFRKRVEPDNKRGWCYITLCHHCPWAAGDFPIAEADNDAGWQRVREQIDAELAGTLPPCTAPEPDLDDILRMAAKREARRMATLKIAVARTT